ncbi:MAG: pyridoxamine 5'-phosphate oxidase family protein [Ilumatobacter fluminis]|uniref:MSMEG_1061 family FMN-dependent PPOX-type flavoprotein n=1 Tax=Ilumatobacter fluminis TaxID=467091 RepID=UPI0032EC648E
MSTADDRGLVRSIEQLEELYPWREGMERKVTPTITPEQARYVEESPFVVVATVGPEGVDCSPRGDPAGFVRIVDERTLMMPDRRGNNRVDTLRNIVRDGRVALLFFVPGIGVTLRVNGTARLLTCPALRASFAMDDKVPTSIIEVVVGEVYTQCPKALVRSDLWNAEHRTHDDVPTVGQVMAGIVDTFDGDAYDAGYPEHMARTIY